MSDGTNYYPIFEDGTKGAPWPSFAAAKELIKGTDGYVLAIAASNEDEDEATAESVRSGKAPSYWPLGYLVKSGGRYVNAQGNAVALGGSTPPLSLSTALRVAREMADAYSEHVELVPIWRD